MKYPLLELGGSGKPLHIAPANGFPPQTYLPLLRPLLAQYRVLALPPRALWNGSTPPVALHDWRQLADDLLAGLREHDLWDVVAVGHSFGGIASLLSVVREPERFRALVLLDPTLLPLPAMELMSAAQQNGQTDQFPLVQAAARRRRRFDSADAAYSNFRGKAAFADWDDEALRLYVQHGTRPSADGGVELVWSPEWEAYYYRTLYTGTWAFVPQLEGLVPMLVLRGTASDTFFPEAAQQLKALLPEITYTEITGHGHLFPQSAPAQTAQVLMDWLACHDTMQG